MLKEVIAVFERLPAIALTQARWVIPQKEFHRFVQCSQGWASAMKALEVYALLPFSVQLHCYLSYTISVLRASDWCGAPQHRGAGLGQCCGTMTRIEFRN
jgi:hypothetical protein